jgi:hypothetical protein
VLKRLLTCPCGRCKGRSPRTFVRNDTRLFTVYFIQHCQNQAVFRDISHRIAIVLVTDIATLIHQHQRRDAPQLENVPFLTVDIRNLVAGIGQADKWDAVFSPIEAVGFGAIRADTNNFRVTRGEGRVIIAQAREMSAAIRSQKPAQEYEDNMSTVLVICEAYSFAIEVIKFEVGGNRKNLHFSSNSFTVFQIESNISTVSLPVNVFCWLG